MNLLASKWLAWALHHCFVANLVVATYKYSGVRGYLFSLRVYCVLQTIDVEQH